MSSVLSKTVHLPIVVDGATVACTKGTKPGALCVNHSTVFVGGHRTASIEDAVAIVNIPSFGRCSATGMRCFQRPVGLWPGLAKEAFFGSSNVLVHGAQLECSTGGRIYIQDAGQTSFFVGVDLLQLVLQLFRVDVRNQRFDSALSYMHSEMITNANSNDVKSIYEFLNHKPTTMEILLGSYDPLRDQLAAKTVWFSLVRQGGPWDHKPKLERLLHLKEPKDDYYFPVRGDETHEYYYDIWSNIHYGYVGTAAGFSRETLQNGAASGVPFAGVNDRGDRISVDIGVDLWEKYGTALTEADLHQAILNSTNELLKATEADPEDDKVIPNSSDGGR